MLSMRPMARKHHVAVCALVALLVLLSNSFAELPRPEQLQITEWARDPMLKDPVALAFDHQGRLYVVESARRGSVDIDIRAHKTWLLEDLANQDIPSLRRFFRKRMAPELSAENQSWLQDRNGDGSHDWRDLTTITEQIRLLEDTNGDGQADRSTVYADGFQEEFTGVAAGVLPVQGDVLFTVYPDLWKLRDLNGDGRADGRVSLFRGFGVHAAFDGHDLHGLTVGPEGKIYFSVGDNGFSVTTKEGRPLHYPNTGGVLRMNPDGSELEVFAYGLRNVQEFDFDQYGNMFGVDNDGDLQDERERAVYIAEGSDSGWRLNWQFRAPGWTMYNGGMTYNPWVAEGMWKTQHSQQPAYITPPMQNYSVGPGGFRFNPGTALNAGYREFFFCVQFPVRKITAFRTRPRGASFEMVDEHVFHGGLMASSVNFGPDGAFYIADWVGMWQPNEQGVIYRLDDPNVDGSEIRKEVQRYLANGVEDQTVVALAELLGHADRRIRQLAQFELVRRRRGHCLLQVANDVEAGQLARVHALWGLIQLRDDKQHRRLAGQLPWADSDAQIRQQCARVAGELRLPSSAVPLVKLLSDERPLVQSHAAIALGKVGSGDAVEPLFLLLERNADLDPFLRHAAVMGLTGCATDKQLAFVSQHASAAVRMGAVLALRRQRSPRIGEFLTDPAVSVLRETVRGIHDDFSIPEALPAAARLLERDDLPADEPIVRRAISANLRVGSVAAGKRLTRFILEPKCVADTPLRESMQIEAVQCLAVWSDVPLVDRVEGRIRLPSPREPQLGKQLLAENFEAVYDIAGPGLTTELTRWAKELKLPISTALMTQWALSDKQPVDTRIHALQLLHQRDARTLTHAIDAAWESNQTQLRRTACQILAERDKQGAWRRIRAAWDDVSMSDRQFFVSLLPQLGLAESDALLVELFDAQLSDRDGDALTLDVVQAARERGTPVFRHRLEQWRGRITKDAWGEFRYALHGGNVVRGEELYRGHVSAQCVRCHDAGGKGKQVGPELGGVASRVNRHYLLESLVDPSATIAKGFESVNLILEDGKVVGGTIIQEDQVRITVATPQAETVGIPTNDVIQRSTNALSTMPKITDVLTPLEVRDLVAFLASLRKP